MAQEGFPDYEHIEPESPKPERGGSLEGARKDSGRHDSRSTIEGSGFGVISKTAGTSRQIQFSLKLIY
jgi:hypothetical protein